MPIKNFKDPFKKSILYYIERIQLDLRYKRCDLLRHTIDPICALANGFVTEKHNGNIEGNHEKYKKNCYITHKAAEEAKELAEKIISVKADKLTKFEKEETIKALRKKHQLHMEHVIPIKAIEHNLISNDKYFIQPKRRKELLNRILELSKPCLVTMEEKIPLDTNELRCTGKYLATPWERYVKAGICLPIQGNNELPSDITIVNLSLGGEYLKDAQDIIRSLPDTLE